MKRFFENQYSELFLWVPILVAIGAAIYFNLPFEPNIPFPILFAILFCVIAFIFWNKIVLCSLLSVLCCGFFYANAYTKFIDTPQIKYTLRNTEISGVVTDIKYVSGRTQVFIDSARGIMRLTSDTTPPAIGDEITATATLYPPSGPNAPESFDYARWAYFNHITATGYMSEFRVESRDNGLDARGSKISTLNSLRNDIHGRANSFLVDTLVLGYKNAIPKSDALVWTATGINHVWSISGFHMTLVGGWLMALFYLIFRSIPSLTRRIPARFPAIICAGAGLWFYLFLSGSDVATIRAFIMTITLFLAFLLGRNSSPLRTVSIAFILLFLINPHFVMQPGFQLSFAAIYGLVWWFNRKNKPFEKKTPPQRIWNFIKIAGETSIIATIFTAPFVAYHFYSMPIYSLVGNMILLPIFSIIIMPLVILGTVFTNLIPVAHSVYNWSFGIAEHIAALPYSIVQTPHISGIALLLVMFGFLCLMFVRNIGKIKTNVILFTVFTIAGIATIICTPRPIFYSTYDNELVGIVNKDGNLEFNKARASNHYFAFDTWREINFEKPTDINTRVKCNAGVCDFGKIVYIQKYVPLAKNIVNLCRDERVEFIVSHFKISAPNCKAKILNGGFVIYENGRIKYTQHGRKWM